MFPAEKEGQWEAFKIQKKAAPVKAEETTTNGEGKPDVEMKDEPPAGKQEQPTKTEEAENGAVQWDVDEVTHENAVWPLKQGRVVEWSCFFALLEHIWNDYKQPFHTPLVIINPPAWTNKDKELVTKFVFEKFKVPAFTMVDSALATSFAFNTPNATVVDVGYEKADISCVVDWQVVNWGRHVGVEGCGGDAMTVQLHKHLEKQGFTKDMSEQLKKSPVCEILLPGTAPPGLEAQYGEHMPSNPAAAASTGADGSGNAQRPPDNAPRGPGEGTEVGIEQNGGNGDNAENGENGEGENGEEDEGVLDVASIVASGRTSEFLAKREQEKAKLAKKAGVDAAAAAAKPVKLPNSKREQTNFPYRELVRNADGTVEVRKRDVDVGVERFFAASGGLLDKLAQTVYETIESAEPKKRAELWNNLIFVGNGSRVRGKHGVGTDSIFSISSAFIYGGTRTEVVISRPLCSFLDSNCIYPGSN